MGQVYSVVAKLEFRDSDSNLFCQIVKDVLEHSLWVNHQRLQDAPEDDPVWYFKFLTTNRADCDGEVWTADSTGRTHGKTPWWTHSTLPQGVWQTIHT